MGIAGKPIVIFFLKMCGDVFCQVE